MEFNNIGSKKKDKISIRWSSTKSSEAVKENNVNDYVASKKVSLTKIMNKKKLLIFLVGFKVIYAVFIYIYIYIHIDIYIYMYIYIYI